MVTCGLRITSVNGFAERPSSAKLAGEAKKIALEFSERLGYRGL